MGLKVLSDLEEKVFQHAEWQPRTFLAGHGFCIASPNVHHGARNQHV